MTMLKNLANKLLDKYIVLFFVLFLVKFYLGVYYLNETLSVGGFVTTVAFVLLFISFSYLFTKRSRLTFLYVLNVLFTIMIFGDALYYKYFGMPFSVYTLMQTSNISGMGASILHMVEWVFLLVLVDILLLPVLFWFGPKAEGKRSWKIFITLAVVAVLLISAKPIKNKYLDNMEPFMRYDAMDLYHLYGPIGAHILDAAFFVDSLNADLSDEERAEIDRWFANKNENQAMSESPFAGIAEGKNLIVIQIESLQNFVINEKVGGEEITPHLNKMLDNSIYFPNFYPQTIEGNSSDAEFLVNTSLFPLKRGSVFFRYPTNDYIALPKLLKEEGYDTFALHGDEGTFWNREQMYPTLGFDSYLDIDSFELDEMIGMGLGDYSFFEQSVPMLDKSSEPFYAFYSTLTNHVPFDMPNEKHLLTLPEQLEGKLLGNYFQTVRYTDEAIGNFIAKLEASGMLENSLVVLYGDHNGIFLKDRPQLEQLWVNETISDEEWLSKYSSIPFIIYNPSFTGETREIVGGQIDFMPTIAYLLGIEEEEYLPYVMGENMLTRREGYALIPGGGYAMRSSVVTDDAVYWDFTQEQAKTLDIADLIIRGNYFKK